MEFDFSHNFSIAIRLFDLPFTQLNCSRIGLGIYHFQARSQMIYASLSESFFEFGGYSSESFESNGKLG